MKNKIVYSKCPAILTIISAFLLVNNFSSGALAQYRSSAVDGAGSRASAIDGAGARASRTDRASTGVPTDRFGDRAGATTFSRGEIDRDATRFESTSNRFNGRERFNNSDNSPAFTRAKKLTPKSYTLRGLRNNQASCDRQFPTKNRFKGKKQLVDSRCANGRQ